MVSTGDSFSIVLMEKECFTFGSSLHGQVGNGDKKLKNLPFKIDVGEKIILAGGHFAFFLTEKGKVFSVGQGDNGQLGHGKKCDLLIPRHLSVLDEKGVLDIKCGCGFSWIMTKTQEIYYTGTISNSKVCFETPTKLNYINNLNFVQISCGHDFSMFSQKEGTTFGIGENSEFGCLGVGNKKHKYKKLVRLSNKFDKIKSAAAHNVFQRGRKVFTCGFNKSGRLGLGTSYSSNKLTPTFSFTINNDDEIHIGGSQTYLVSKNKILGCGWNHHGQLMDNTKNDIFTLTKLIDIDVDEFVYKDYFEMKRKIMKNKKFTDSIIRISE